MPPSKSLFFTKPNCGLPIGNLTSQLFSNIYLHDLDVYITKVLGLSYYGRYVDDFVIVHRDKAYLQKLVNEI
ncbi:MAG: RNA-directed DNA polymerase [Candidatus Peribacteria bacterium]|nr:RNA-directed DNA polymerase [Candidatus Peribacteria bacterium]